MTQKEIFFKEENNYTRIFLYREGIFWKAYEKSAYRIASSFQTFKPIKKYVKTVGEAIVSIGFPCAVLEKYIAKGSVTSSRPGTW
ncbi:hypothetical protein [Bacteroides sp. 51]|uniref:hypothetical protein n=1 Tax=Bacteroides sp. 51 TaxID=2302938 RepID=UPI0013D33FCE|nr:hypothetical protein [Bacteroides sp. 51]NDV84975.1 hypothetical protein [Bacteroides sp. 51]